MDGASDWDCQLLYIVFPSLSFTDEKTHSPTVRLTRAIRVIRVIIVISTCSVFNRFTKVIIRMNINIRLSGLLGLCFQCFAHRLVVTLITLII